ncbi:subtilisin-like protease SBT3.13 [Trifolium pratense]|uniref:subtilisin-like protease SBT3.13 n=1 Tax=Trifolium pratense TaxID=57577 RepID=UPI001E690747|nr:subtilisin-like protease SBT3.13 [Trifolium pratense]
MTRYLRDHRGVFVAAGTNWFEGNCAIVEGESIALLEALKEIAERGISNVIFEMDSKSVVDAIHNIKSGSSDFSSLICHVKHVLLSNPNFVVKFIKRQANMVAHTKMVAYMDAARTYTGLKPAPIIMAGFSSRGPSVVQPLILKPDITVPRVNIYGCLFTGR